MMNPGYLKQQQKGPDNQDITASQPIKTIINPQSQRQRQRQPHHQPAVSSPAEY
jgi:hypothetical protein